MKKPALYLAMAFAALFVSGPILAHHGETNYDTDNLVSMKETVTSFQFINPHVQVFLDATNVKGEVENWTCVSKSTSNDQKGNGGERKNGRGERI